MFVTKTHPIKLFFNTTVGSICSTKFLRDVRFLNKKSAHLAKVQILKKFLFDTFTIWMWLNSFTNFIPVVSFLNSFVPEITASPKVSCEFYFFYNYEVSDEFTALILMINRFNTWKIYKLHNLLCFWVSILFDQWVAFHII
jgi:hypothetical protein